MENECIKLFSPNRYSGKGSLRRKDERSKKGFKRHSQPLSPFHFFFERRKKQKMRINKLNPKSQQS